MHYEKEKKLEEAVEMYAKALQISPDPNIREQMEDCELEVFRNNLLIAKEVAAKHADDDSHRRKAAELNGELVKREIEVLSRRVERYPQNLQVKFDLARRFVRVKKWSLAIPLFQQASADSRLKVETLINLAKCFVNTKQRPLGLRQLERVLPEVNPHDQKENFCEAHYLLGVLFQEGGDTARAENHFTEVIGVDYNYKDAAKRLGEIQGSSGDAGGQFGAEE
jgi:tetratricopeptide (TPR) repeat protein